MRLSTLLSFIAFIVFSNLATAQNNYWTESFESTNIPGNSSGASTTPTDVTLPSGVWKMYYTYRGSAGSCDGKPLRIQSTTVTGANGSSFAVTPTFSNGVGQLFFVENSGSPRTVAIYKSTDNGATFTLLQNVTTGGATCDTTILTINDATITKLKFANETTSNIGLDNMKVSKNGTLIDGLTGGGGGGNGPADTTAYYPDTASRLPAFPGAEGAGKYTRGGRGGVVIEVTNLDDDAAGNTVGSFRWAQKQNTGPKTIVFRVSGTIHLQAALSFQRGDVTVAGQTAPGDGICLADFPVTIGKSNVIIRHMRFRLGDVGIARTGYSSSSADAVNSSGGANADSMILDHCTASWSIDEDATFKNMTHFTMQNCMISEPLNNSDHSGELHGYGGIWGGVNATFHHNLFAHCSNRNCRFNGSRQYTNGEIDTVDFRNNVIYDWGINTVYGGEGGYYNIVNNYYKPGPSTNSSVISRTWNPYQAAPLPYAKAYMTGNYMASSQDVTNNNWLGVKMEDGTTPLADTGLSKLNYQVKTYRVTTHTALDAYDYVLKNAGATLPKRDTVDQRIVREVMNGTGRIIDDPGGYPAFTDTTLTKGAWPTLLSRTAPVDYDHDGMADEWELQRGLNPANAADRNGISPNGYTNLENYLNGDSIVAFGTANTCIPVPAVTATSTNTWLNAKDTSYIRLISTDTSNVVAAIKDAGNYGAFNVSYYTTNTTRTFNGKAYLNRNITITPANAGAITSPVTIRVYFSKAEFDALKAANSSINSLTDLRVLKASDNNCPSAITGSVIEITPTASGVYGTYSNGYYLECQTQTFSTFFIGSAGSALPLSLVNFKASYNGKEVNTEWSTVNEVNTKAFVIERSADAINFVSVGSVPARNISSNQNYNFTDVNPLSGTSYYRLKMIDTDNRFTLSQSVLINIKNGSGLSIYPNPVHNNIVISHPKAAAGATIQVVNEDGKKVISYNTTVNSVQTSILTTNLTPGMYYLMFENNGQKLMQKFVKQ
jgi:hypothetical protein